MKLHVPVAAFSLLSLLSINSFAQRVPDGLAARMVDNPRDLHNIDQSRELTSTLGCGACNFLVGEAFQLALSYQHSSPDQEWTDGLILHFPEGVTVLSASAVTGGAQSLPFNGQSGNGATLTWGDTLGGSGEGLLYVNASFSVQILVDASVGDAFELNYRAVGDGWGAPPHFSEGVLSLTEGGSVDLAVLSIESNHAATDFAHANIGFIPYVRVQNTGLFTVSQYAVQLTSMGGGEWINHTLEVDQPLEAGAQALLQMPCYTPTQAGAMALTATVILESDDNMANNSAFRNYSVYPFAPTTAPVAPRSIAEYEPNKGGMIRARTNFGGQAEFDVPMSLMVEISHDDILYMVCSSTQQNAVQTALSNGGVNMANVQYLLTTSNSPWTRDYGPWFIEHSDAEVGIINFPYNRARPADNNIPIATAGLMNLPHFNYPIMHTGGNYMSTGDGVAASDDLVLHENDCLDPDEVLQASTEYLGIHTYHYTPNPLNSWLQHIDTWGKFLAPDKIMILQVPPSDPNHNDLEAVAAYFATQMSGYGYPFKVYRVFTPNAQPYANAMILNKKLLLPVNPTYGTSCLEGAIQSFEQAMPGYEVVVSSFNQWWSQDALHCRVKQITDEETLRIVHQPYHDTLDWVPSLPFSAQVYSLSANGVNREESALLHYRINGGNYQSASMSDDGGFMFSSLLSGLQPNTGLCYYIAGTNNNNRSQTHPFSGEAEPHCVYLKGEPLFTHPQAETAFMLYPNPAREEVFIQARSAGVELHSIQVFSLDGRLLLSQNIPAGSATGQVQLSLEGLSRGVYVLQLQSAQGAHGLKVVKE